MTAHEMGGGAPPGDEYPVIVYDGACAFCNRWVQFVLTRDSAAQYRFVASQSEAGRRVLGPRAPSSFTAPLSSIVLREGGILFDRSTAVLQILRGLGGPWVLCAIFLAVPPCMRDAAYNAAARRRYGFFARGASCQVPAPDLRRRLL